MPETWKNGRIEPPCEHELLDDVMVVHNTDLGLYVVFHREYVVSESHGDRETAIEMTRNSVQESLA